MKHYKRVLDRQSMTAAFAFVLLMLTILAGCSKAGTQQIQQQLDLGNRYLSELNYEQAALTFQGVIEIEDRNVDAWHGYARANVGLAENTQENQAEPYYEAAETAYLTVIELEPERTEGYTELAQVYEETGRMEQAVELLERVPDNVTDPDEVARQLEDLRLRHYAELRVRVMDGEEPAVGAQVNVTAKVQEAESGRTDQADWLSAMEAQLPAGIINYATANEEPGYFNAWLYDLNRDSVPEVMADTVGETDFFYLDSDMVMHQLALGDRFCLLSDGTLIDQSMRFDSIGDFRFTKYLYDADRGIYQTNLVLDVVPSVELYNQMDDFENFDVYQISAFYMEGAGYDSFSEALQVFSPEFAERIDQAAVDGNQERVVESIMSIDAYLIDTIEDLNDFPQRLEQYAQSQRDAAEPSSEEEKPQANGSYSAQTDQDGWCIQWLPEGDYRVDVVWNDTEVFHRDVTLTQGQRLKMEEIQTQAAANETGAMYGETIRRGDSLYYWHYNRDTFHEAELFGYYTPDPDIPSRLVQNTGGEETVLTEEAGMGILCLTEDRIYYQTRTDGAYDAKPSIRTVSLSGGDAETVAKGELLGVTSDGCYLVYQADGIAAWDIAGERSIALTDSEQWPTYIALHDDLVYYATTDYTSGELTISRIAPDGSDSMKLVTVESIDGGSYMGEARFPVVNGEAYLYFSFGSIGGSGGFYQGGKIARVNLDGTGGEVIAGGEMVNGIEQLLSADYSVNEDGTVFSYDVEEERVGEMLYSGMTEYSVRDGIVSQIESEYGQSVALFAPQDYAVFSSIPAETVDGDELVRAVSVERQGDEAFLRLEHSFYAPEGDVGWRTAYRLRSGMLLRKDLTAGTVEVVYQY